MNVLYNDTPYHGVSRQQGRILLSIKEENAFLCENCVSFGQGVIHNVKKTAVG